MREMEGGEREICIESEILMERGKQNSIIDVPSDVTNCLKS